MNCGTDKFPTLRRHNPQPAIMKNRLAKKASVPPPAALPPPLPLHRCTALHRLMRLLWRIMLPNFRWGAVPLTLSGCRPLTPCGRPARRSGRRSGRGSISRGRSWPPR